MKIENTLENRTKFVLQYCGQDILRAGTATFEEFQYSECVQFTYTIGKSSYLDLTPLSQITDEHAIEVIKIFKGYSGMHKSTTKIDRDSKEIFKQFYWTNPFVDGGFQGIDDQTVIANFSNEGIHVLKSNRESDYWYALDFLRSQGYALPWMGISVQELIEWGWVKIKEEL